MRNFLVGLAGGFVALVGFAGTASALVSISLLWEDNNTSNITDPTGSIQLNVYIDTGPGPTTRGGSLSVDWSLAPELAYSSFSTPGDFDLALPGTTQPGSQLRQMGAFSLAFEPVSTLVLFGTITFDVTPGAAGITSLTSLYTATDLIENMDLAGFGGATITRTPEPGTLSLLVMGLSGLYVVGRRRGR